MTGPTAAIAISGEAAAKTSYVIRRRIWWCGLAAAIAWLVVAGVTEAWPDDGEVAATTELAAGMAVFGLILLSASLASRYLELPRLIRAGPWLIALAFAFGAWEVSSAKLQLLPLPFFAAPQALLDVYIEDWPRLGESAARSIALLATGYLLGAVAGFCCGVTMGWSSVVGYWMHPLLRFIGPLPATAWLPVAFFAFPSSHSAGVFLIALATGFPVTVLTWSGVSGVNAAYYEVARTLGARPAFLVLKVAIPAALPSVFVGLFMGLGSSFAVLVVAEMMGVKAGLGWYLSWAQGWAAYANMYAALIVMALLFSGLISLLFRLRDRLLAWQRGLLRW